MATQDFEARRKALARIIDRAIRQSPVAQASYYSHGYLTTVRLQDGEYVVATSRSGKYVIDGRGQPYVRRTTSLDELAHGLEYNEWQGGDHKGWVPEGR